MYAMSISKCLVNQVHKLWFQYVSYSEIASFEPEVDDLKEGLDVGDAVGGPPHVVDRVHRVVNH